MDSAGGLRQNSFFFLLEKRIFPFKTNLSKRLSSSVELLAVFYPDLQRSFNLSPHAVIHIYAPYSFICPNLLLRISLRKQPDIITWETHKYVHFFPWRLWIQFVFVFSSFQGKKITSPEENDHFFFLALHLLKLIVSN